MIGYRDVAVGAGMVDGGLQKMGVTGEVHIALTAESGRRLEAAYCRHARFADMRLPGQRVLRTCVLNGIRYRWPKSLGNW